MAKTSSKNKYMNNGDRLNQILDVACRLFAEKSYDAVSIREIAKECDCSPALVMKNFKSKEDIYSTLLNEWKEMCNEPLIKEVPKGDACSALEKIYNFLISGGNQYTHPYRDNLANAVVNRVSYQKTVAEIKASMQDVSTEIILPLIIQGQEEKVFREGNPKEIANNVWFIIYGVRLLNESFSYVEPVRFDLVKEFVLGV